MPEPPSPLRTHVVVLLAVAALWHAVLLGGPLIAHYLKGH